MIWSIWNGTEWQTVLGIQNGLEVVIDDGQQSVKVISGKAIDGNGEICELGTDKADLTFTSNTVNLIVISKDDGVEVITDSTSGALVDTHIQLAYLNVDDGGNITAILPEAEDDTAETTINFTQLPTPQVVSVNGVDAAWIKVQLDPRVPLPPGQELTQITSITADVEVAHSNLTPDLCYCNDEPLDLTKDYYPLGEQPRFNDTFYVASQKVLAEGGQDVTVQVTLSDSNYNGTGGEPQLTWEAWDGNCWSPLTVSNGTGDFTSSGENFALTLSGFDGITHCQ